MFAGMLFGAIIAHPYAMLVQYISAEKAPENSIIYAVVNAFSPSMLPMTLAFSFFCAVIALLVALLFERNKRIVEIHSREQQQIAVSAALRRLVSVLSHFIIHASMSILLEIRRLRRKTGQCNPDELMLVLSRIEKQAEKNEAIMGVIREPAFLDSLQRGGSVTKLKEITEYIERHVSD